MINPTQPIKKLPEILIYTNPNTGSSTMLNTKIGKVVGSMMTRKRNDLFINWLEIKPDFKRQGYGKMFLKYAQYLSKQLGCEGRLRVLASATEKDKNLPHGFYRKCGFTSDNKKIIEKIDESIKTNKPLGFETTPQLYMYYPDKNL